MSNVRHRSEALRVACNVSRPSSTRCASERKSIQANESRCYSMQPSIRIEWSCRPPVPPAGGRLTHLATRKERPMLKDQFRLPKRFLVGHTVCRGEDNFARQAQPPSFLAAIGQVRALAEEPMPNPSIERTRSGSAGLAFISFWANPALPVRAAHVKR